MRSLAARAAPSTAAMRHVEAMLLPPEGEAAEAVELPQSLREIGADIPGFHVQLGQRCLSLERVEGDESSASRSISIPTTPRPTFGLARLRLAQRRFLETAGETLASMDLPRPPTSC